MKAIITALVALFFVQASAQQSYESIKKLQERKLFEQAIGQYTKLLAEGESNAEVAFELGVCYYNINRFEEAAQNFNTAVISGNESMECRFMLAQTQLRLLQYDKAEVLFRELLTETATTKSDSLIQTESRIRLNTLRSVSQSSKKASDLVLQNMPNINSEFSDYGITMLGDALYFSSMRKMKNNHTDSRTLQGFSDIYTSQINTSDFEDPKTEWISEPINSMKFNEACPVFANEGATLYFTRCFGKPSHCEIMQSTKNKKGQWSNVEKINLSSDEYSIGHPAISPDGNTMVFVSDMPGGFGKRDLYVSTRQNELWSDAQNTGGMLNTSSDEMFPRFLNDSVLVFSSEGHRSYGGLDVFVTVLRNGEWQKPIRMAPGINTGADDFDLLMSASEKGLFCSNRPGGYGSDDIYQFNGFPVLIPLNILITDVNSGEPITNAVVIMRSAKGTDTLKTDENGYAEAFLQHVDEADLVIAAENYRTEADQFATNFEKKLYPDVVDKTYAMTPDNRGITVEGEVIDQSNQKPIDNQKLMIMGENGYFDQTSTDSAGAYEFTHLQDDNAYKLLMARKGYWTQSKDLTIPALETSFNYSKKSGFDLDFEMVPINQNEEIIIKDIYYDFDKASLKKESEVELNKVVTLLNNNPNISIEINSHTDNRGPDDYNMRLSQARAESVVKYLASKGISPKRLVSKGYGETRPLIANAQSENDHQMNRRTSFKVVSVADINDNEIISTHVTQAIPESNESQNETTGGNVIYKVQVCASRTPIESDSYFQKLNVAFPDLLVVEEKYPDGFYRYIAGTFTSYNEAVTLRDKITGAGYPDCFIGAYSNNKRIK